jgi:tRNA (guanosine-2'-O-)-methyltransferase
LVTKARLERIRQVAESRTWAVVPVLDGLVDPHNVSAVLRSCEAFGIQELHVIEGPHGFAAAHRVAKGTNRWLDVFRHKEATSCLQGLKDRGYSIIAASVGGRLKPSDLATLPNAAFVFGSEHRGIGDAVRRLADDTYEIPMCGFVESLNVSVAAAITLQAATAGGRRNDDDERTRRLIARFLFGSLPNAGGVLQAYERSASG